MYESFYGLNTKPFELLPNPAFLFLGKSHKKAAIYLDYALHERAGFVLLTGEVGAGKTTLLRDLIEKNRDAVVLCNVFNTTVDPLQLLALIADDFGVPSAGRDKAALLTELNRFLVEQYAAGRRPMLVIDEAQNLSPEALEEIRLLSNLETNDSKLLQIILAGQPELRQTLARPELRQLRQRIGFSCHLQPLGLPEVEEYLRHRLTVAGNAEAVIFAPEALRVIWSYSRGIPRLINAICDFLLLSAFAAQTKEISGALAREVVGELDLEKRRQGEPDEGAAPARFALGNSGAGSVSDALEEMLARLEAIEQQSGAAPRQMLAALGARLDNVARALRAHMQRTDERLTLLEQRVKESTAPVEELDEECPIDLAEEVDEQEQVNDMKGRLTLAKLFRAR